MLTNPSARDRRFGIRCVCRNFTRTGIGNDCQTDCQTVDIGMTDDGAFEIAKRCRGTPRLADASPAMAARLYADILGGGIIDAKAADAALNRLDVDHATGFVAWIVVILVHDC